MTNEISDIYVSSTGKYNFGTPSSPGVFLQGMGTSPGISVNGTFVMGNNYVNFGVSAGTGGYGLGVSQGGSIMVKNRGGDWTVITDIVSGGGSTSPGGTNTQVQFNSNGSFEGDPNFTWNTSSNTLAVNEIISVSSTSNPSLQKISLNSTTQGACIKMGSLGVGNPTITLDTTGNTGGEAMITLEESTGTRVGLELGIEGSDFNGGIISAYETTRGISTLVISGGVSDSNNSYVGSAIEMKRRKNDGTSIISPFTFDAPNLEMVLRNDNSGASVSFGMSTSQTSATNFILPTSNGTSGYVLETDGSGNTSWTAATNSFSTIAVTTFGATENVVATSSTDTLTFVASGDISFSVFDNEITIDSTGGGGGGTPGGIANDIQFNDGFGFYGDSRFQIYDGLTGGVCALTVDGHVFSSMGVSDVRNQTPSNPYQISATDFVNGFIFPPCQSSDENQLFVVKVPSYADIAGSFPNVLKAGQTFDTVIYGTSIGSSAGISYPSDITVLENAGVSFDRRLGSGNNPITTGLSFHFADATLPYYQGVVIRSRMGSAGVSMYPYATSFYTC